MVSAAFTITFPRQPGFCHPDGNRPHQVRFTECLHLQALKKGNTRDTRTWNGRFPSGGQSLRFTRAAGRKYCCCADLGLERVRLVTKASEAKKIVTKPHFRVAFGSNPTEATRKAEPWRERVFQIFSKNFTFGGSPQTGISFAIKIG